jgi:hypothetical protein
LARLFAISNPPWILKGGYAMELRYRPRARITRDIDLTCAADEQSPLSRRLIGIRDRMQEAEDQDLGDHLTFRIGLPVMGLSAELRSSGGPGRAGTEPIPRRTLLEPKPLSGILHPASELTSTRSRGKLIGLLHPLQAALPTDGMRRTDPCDGFRSGPNPGHGLDPGWVVLCETRRGTQHLPWWPQHDASAASVLRCRGRSVLAGVGSQPPWNHNAGERRRCMQAWARYNGFGR